MTRIRFRSEVVALMWVQYYFLKCCAFNLASNLILIEWILPNHSSAKYLRKCFTILFDYVNVNKSYCWTYIWNVFSVNCICGARAEILFFNWRILGIIKQDGLGAWKCWFFRRLDVCDTRQVYKTIRLKCIQDLCSLKLCSTLYIRVISSEQVCKEVTLTACKQGV